ncbi:MAG: PA0069 family radical SAM protein [Brevundimonas sp.]|jgi:DNA repair photolyase|uniref:PA0069 family radical SAM protein n=1 Tax=Brevundimonas sp. TaxID=1871086 RepID=UPI00391AD4F8
MSDAKIPGPRANPLGEAARGRGARANASGRYELYRHEAFDDGWADESQPDAPLRTTLTPETARRILTRNDSPDIGFDLSINAYRGCEHGCIYCYARPSHAYMGLSPGLDFESRLFFKPDAPRLLRRELSNPRYRCVRIHVGANTDPYQPVEREQKITRQILEVLEAFNQPFSIITKSALIVRDLDILSRMAQRRLCSAFISLTTLDPALTRAMEPRAATPRRRLDAIRALSKAGVPVGVGFAPVIPGLNDHEMEAVLEAAAEAGASTAMYVVLRLPLEIHELFEQWLHTARPERARRVMSLVRQMRSGKAYQARFGERMRGEGPVAELIASRFRMAVKRHGLTRPRHDLDTTQFRVPEQMRPQLDLFA